MLATVIVCLIIAVAVFFAAASMFKNKGGCSCGCNGCTKCSKNGRCGGE